MHRRSLFPGLVALVLAVTSPLLRAADAPVVDVLNASEAKNFARLVGATGRAESLAGKPFTLLAPVDSALPAAKVDELLRPENAAAAAKFVDGHVIPQSLDAGALKRRRSWTTADGGTVAVALERGKLTLGGARIVGEPKVAAGGFVYRLEKPAVALP